MGECDYLVVGAGSAGCIVAARLAEAGHSTTLIEAGPPDRNPYIHVPAGVRYLHSNPATTWLDTAETGPDAGSRTIPWPHGRVVGGSGSINGMIFIRGLASDFDHWADLGCAGWDYESVLPSFRSLENYRGQAGPHRGTEGPLPVEDPRFRLRATELYVQSAQAAGHKRLDDLNAANPLGVGLAQMNRFGRFRGSSARAFLGRARRTGNLTVIANAQVDRLEFDGGHCTGVRLRRAGVAQSLKARREVIVAAGAIGAPRLLQLSGIGDAAHLDLLGIPVVLDRPSVGENLQDHYSARMSFRLKDIETMNERTHAPRLWWEIAKWAVIGKGVLTTGITAAMLFCKSSPELDAPDLQLLFSPSSFDDNHFGMLEREPGALITVVGCHPGSRGRVRIETTDPNAPPHIAARYLSDPRDLQTLMKGVAEARRILAHDPIARHFSHERHPGGAVEGEALADYIRNFGQTVYHPVGTCRMGADRDAVVDSRLRVNGVSGLRIMDASIMPRISSGNTNAPTMLIAEHGVKMLLAERNAYA